MEVTPAVKAGDRCPNDGGVMIVDEAQDPEKMIDKHSRNAHSAFTAARFADRVREKAKEFGVIHKCVSCGYRARFKSADDGDDGGGGELETGAAAGHGGKAGRQAAPPDAGGSAGRRGGRPEPANT
jgi:hypothetical protein